MTQENIDIRVREDGSRAVSRNILGIGGAAEKSASQVDLLQKALGYLGAYLAIDKLKQYADAWASAVGQIKIATTSTEEAAAVTERLFAAAQNSRAPFSELVQLYSRAARAGKELGTSQAELIKFSGNIGKALSIQGTSAEQAKGALLQLGQALGGGVVRAEEFNSIIEGAPYILQVVANNLDGAGGSVSKLRKIMLDGKLTSKAFFDAFQKGGADIERDFAKAPQTIAQSFTTLNNALEKYVGELDKSLGISTEFGKVAKFIADNMDQIATVAFSLGAAILVAMAPGPVLAFAGAIKTLYIAINSHPFVAIAAAIAGAVVYLYKFRDALSLGLDDITTIGDLLRALGEIALRVFDTLTFAASGYFSDIKNFAASAYAAITGSTQSAAEDWAGSFGAFYSDVGTGFAGVVKGIAKTIDAIAGLITGLGIGIYRVFAGLPELVATPFKQVYNKGVDMVENLINATIEGINKLRKIVGTELLETVKFERASVDDAYFTKYGENIAGSIDAGFESQGGALLATVDGVFKRAQEIAKERAALLRFNTKPDTTNLNNPLGAGGKPEQTEAEAKALKKLQDELAGVFSKVDPLRAAYLEMGKAREALHKAQKAGLITLKEELDYGSKLAESYNHIIDPLGVVNKELDTQTRLLGLSAQARAVEAQALDIESKLRADGVKLTKAESAALRAKLVDQQRATEMTATQDALLANSVEQRRAFVVQLQAIQALLANPTSGFTKGDAAQAIVSQNAELLANTQIFADAQTAMYDDMYKRIKALQDAHLLSESDAEIARQNVSRKANEVRLQQADSFFGNLATLSQSGNKKLAEVGKAAAIAQATISGYVAIQNALAVQPYPVGIALAAGAAVAAAANISSIMNTKGYELGGYTGDLGRKQVAGVVHGREFVNDADSTSRNRPALEYMNNGGSWQDLKSGGKMNVEVHNYGSSQIQVEQVSEDRIRIIAREETRRTAPEVIAGELSSPNSRVSSAAKNNLQGGGRRR